MTRWLWRLFLLAAVGGLVYWAIAVLFPSPERVIRKRFAEVAQLVSFSGNEAPLAKLMNTQKLAGYFATDVDVLIDVPGRSQQSLHGRREIIQAAGAARNTLTALKVEFPDVIVTVNPDRRSAVANVTVTAVVSGERDMFVQELKCILQKNDGNWLLSRLETVKTLR
jgi:hypothetical protein